MLYPFYRIKALNFRFNIISRNSLNLNLRSVKGLVTSHKRNTFDKDSTEDADTTVRISIQTLYPFVTSCQDVSLEMH